MTNKAGEQPTPLERMTALDEELEQHHPGWMTGEQPTITQSNIEQARKIAAEAHRDVSRLMRPTLGDHEHIATRIEQGYYDTDVAVIAAKDGLEWPRTTSLAAQDGLVEALRAAREFVQIILPVTKDRLPLTAQIDDALAAWEASRDLS